MRILTICSLAGGYGKTTTTLSLGSAIAARGLHVVVADLDAQASATLALGQPATDFPLTTALRTLDVVPRGTSHRTGTFRLAPGGRMLAAATSRDIHRHLDRVSVGADVLLVDTAPGLGVGTLEGLRRASLTLIPLRPTPPAITTLGDTLTALAHVSSAPRARAVLTQVNSRRGMVNVVSAGLRARHPGVLYDVAVPDDARCEQAVLAKCPVTVFAPRSKASIAYEQLADVVLADLGISRGMEGSDVAA